MVDLRDLQCLAALARHRHFARAASECGLSQPAFSMRIRSLEERLGTTIVRRGNRFQGLTREGDTILAHALRILDEARALEQDVRAARGEVSGSLHLGVIPTAAAHAAQTALWLKTTHPGIRLRVDTTNSLAIQQGVEAGAFDAGITYTEGASRDLLTVEPLFVETYRLLCPRTLAPRAQGDVTWAEAAALPLSLLEPQMQNRRILDRIFTEIGVAPNVIAETGGLTTAILMVVQGLSATVVPRSLTDTLGPLADIVVLPLVEPAVETPISLVTPQRLPHVPTVEALRATLASHRQ